MEKQDEPGQKRPAFPLPSLAPPTTKAMFTIDKEYMIMYKTDSTSTLTNYGLWKFTGQSPGVLKFRDENGAVLHIPSSPDNECPGDGWLVLSEG